MIPNTIIAALLLTTPPNVKSDYSVFATPPIMESIQKTAISLEILDHREKKYLMSDRTAWSDVAEGFNADLRMLQTRYQNLKDAPPSLDVMRFPDRVIISEMMDFNRRYRDSLVNGRSLDPGNQGWYDAAITETDELYLVWDKVRDATCAYYYVTITRQSLKDLRSMLGVQAYNNVELPPYVPVWRFRKIE